MSANVNLGWVVLFIRPQSQDLQILSGSNLLLRLDRGPLILNHNPLRLTFYTENKYRKCQSSMLQIARVSIYFSKSVLYIFKCTHRYTVIRYKVFTVYYKWNISTESKVGQYNTKGKENRQCGEKVHLIFCVAYLQSTQYIQCMKIFINLPISGLWNLD